MPISAEQWRAVTGSLNAGKGSLRPGRSFKPSSSFCDLLYPPPSSDWKDYYTAMVLLCTPLLLYRLYLVCVVIMMYLVSGPGAKTLISSPYTNEGLSADVSISFMTDDVPHLLFTSLSVLLYVAMVIVVVSFGIKEHMWTRKKYHWVLTQQLDHLDLYLLNFGPDYEVIFDPETHNVYATLSMKDMHSEPVLKCVQMTNERKKKNVGHMIGVVVSFFLQLSPLVVLAMLLLLAGDVERNPGPIHGLDLATLTKELSPAKDKWHEIGIQLGIPPTELSAIEDMFPTVDRRLSEMLVYWLDGNTKSPICWESILEGLRAATVNKKGLAEELKQRYCQQDFTRKRPRRLSAHQTESEDASDEDQSSNDPLMTQRATLSAAAIQMGHESSPSPKKLKYYFPYLDLSKLSATRGESEALQAKLSSDFNDMTKKFQHLFTTIRKSLEERKKCAADILACVCQFKALEPVYTDLHSKQLEFRHQFPELKRASLISEAMNIIGDYSSFFNYSLVEEIVLGLGTDEDIAQFERYKKEFQEYAKRSVFECPPELGIAGKDWPSFIVKVHHKGFQECSLDHLRHFTNQLAEALHLPIGLLILDSVTPGCLELVVQVPLPSYQNMFPLSSQQEQDLTALGVIRISAGDYQYPSSRDEDHNDSDHKDDKPDDGPDDKPSDSGFDTLSTVLSELSDLKMPMDMTDRDITNPYEIDNYYDHDSEAQRQDDTKKHLKVGHLTPLHIAAYFGRIDDVRILVETNTFSPMEKDQQGNTALHCAVEGHHLDILKYFIETRLCDPSTMFTGFGETPLHLAARLARRP